MTYRTKADRNGFRRNLTLDLSINDANVVAINLHKELKTKTKAQSQKGSLLTMSYQQVMSCKKEVKILSLKGIKRMKRGMNTSLEALKNIFNSAGGSIRKLNDRSIEIQNLKEENRVKENEQNSGEMGDTIKYTKVTFNGDSRM